MHISDKWNILYNSERDWGEPIMFKETVEKYYPEMKAIREDIHRHPELSYKEERTSALIMEKLKEYGVDSVERTWMTGLVALIKGGKGEGKCIAIRADMDALPVTEETGVEFASENKGVMHACGHDMHITILLTAARILCENRDKFPGSVKLIFQPAEEAANPSDTTGGALHMVEYGCMENPHVDAIIALHMNPATPDHNCQFAIKKGVITSGFDIYRFDVHGKTAHGSQPQNGNDAILALSQLIVLLQQVVSRNTDPLKTAILSVGTISGGSRVNIIPDYATAGGCFRYYDNETAKVIRENTFAIAKGVETLSGCKVDVQALTGYACVENDDKLVNLISETLTEELGENSVVWLDEPASGSEDFSYYGLATGTPATLMWLNCEQYTGEETYALHSSKCIFKPEAIKAGAEGFVSIAIKYLNS